MRCVFLLFLVAACTPSPPDAGTAPPEGTGGPPSPALLSPADSLAWRIAEASGGLAAWAALPRLRFDFVSVRDTGEAYRARHLWDRRTGRYRVEYPAGGDTTVVALFDLDAFEPDAPEGAVYLDGRPLEPEQARERLREAHQRAVNDTYWLLAPLKLFDPGVRRALAPDSARAGERTLALAFEGVGLTPGDRYWLSADVDGRLRRWSYVLESGRTGSWRWEDPVTVATPAGPVVFYTARRTAGRAILTPVLPADGLPEDVFSRPSPAL